MLKFLLIKGYGKEENGEKTNVTYFIEIMCWMIIYAKHISNIC